MKDAALAQECRDLQRDVETLRLDPHARTARDVGAVLARLLHLVTHLAARVDALEPTPRVIDEQDGSVR